MPPEDSALRRIRLRARAAFDLARLDLAMLTGGRAFVLLIVVTIWFGLFALWALARDDPWSPSTYHVLMLVIPGTLLVVALGMMSVIAERDAGRLETLFVSPMGRHAFWAQRFAALFLACWSCTGALSLLTWAIVDRSHEPVNSWLHAGVPLAFALSLTVLLTLLFRSSAIGGLCSSAALIGISFVAEIVGGRWDYWFNPFSLRDRFEDPEELLRQVVFNRSLYLLLAALCLAGVFALLQRRERLL